jgi:hypothetical protein
MKTGREIPLKPYARSEKALQSSVRRLEKMIESGLYFSRSQLLERLYSFYRGSLWGRPGFSLAEAEMLKSLAQPDHD